MSVPETPEAIAAWVAKTSAETQLLAEQRRRAVSEADIAQAMAEGATIARNRETRKEEEDLAGDSHHRVLRWNGTIEKKLTYYVTSRFDEWRRIDRGNDRPYRLELTSEGGDIISGLALYDYLIGMKERPLTVVASGLCASMATVILQAGTERLSYPGTSWLIHRASFMAMGREDEIEDTRKHVELLQGRIFEILAGRSKMTVAELKSKSKRTDWWFLGTEAYSLGLVDGLA